jgi:anti-anti-sigma regulatory factor
MSIQRWSQDVILVDLPEDLTTHGELKTVTAMLRAGCVSDVVLDFSRVQVVGGAWLTQLQKIQRLVHEGGHKLILCGVAPGMRGVFSIAHIEDLFEFAEDSVGLHPIGQGTACDVAWIP